MTIYFRSSQQNFENALLNLIQETNALLNLIQEQDGIDKTHLYVKDLSEPKYEFSIKRCEGAGIKHFNNSNAFTEY